ncbi:MAG: hypothetical protein KDD85_14005 [Parvularculaceae bacterium]|nr:hypothetical protein [Parvularculaceae bacterium]
MKAKTVFGAATLFCVTPAAAGESEPHFAPFDVTQTRAAQTRDIASFEVAGAPIAFNAYGRYSRARKFGVVREITNAHRLGQAFDPATKPAFVTLEASVRF